MIGMFAHRFNVVPQGSKISKGCRLVLRAAQQSGRVEGTHEQDAALFVQLAMLLGHGEILSDHPLGGNAAKADHDLWLQQAELLPQPGIQASLSAGWGSRFCGGRHLTMFAI